MKKRSELNLFYARSKGGWGNGDLPHTTFRLKSCTGIHEIAKHRQTMISLQ